MLLPSDKLTKSLVTETLNWDKKDNLNKAPRNQRANHLNSLVKTICSCGISLVCGKNRMQMAKEVVSTSLIGTDKKLLLEKLPTKLNGIINPTTSSTVIKIWQVLSMKIYNYYCT